MGTIGLATREKRRLNANIVSATTKAHNLTDFSGDNGRFFAVNEGAVDNEEGGVIGNFCVPLQTS